MAARRRAAWPLPACATPSPRATHVPGDGPVDAAGRWPVLAARRACGVQPALAMPGDDAALNLPIEFDCATPSEPALETVVSPVFDRVANTFVDSLRQARPKQVHGAR